MSDNVLGRKGHAFLGVVAALYILVFALRPAGTLDALRTTVRMLWNIVPILVLVVGVMTFTNYFITPAWVKANLGSKGGYRRWAFAMVGGVLSTGPIFLWYPFMKDLKTHGAGHGFITVFLYNRAIKLPLLPVLVYYFGFAYVIVLTIVMAAASLIQGKLMELLAPD
ncbi:hypothetical protein EF808_06505 [archaeon]|nr:MAG: hypothetical protein EF808_06505 [archaeon]